MYAPSLYGGYDASVFPGVADTFDHEDWQMLPTELDKITTALQAVKDALSNVIVHSI